MASSPLNKKSHARSNSLPSRPHPLILDCNEHLCRSESSASSDSSSLSCKLIGLQDLHDCVEKLLQLPQMQQAFVERCNNGKWVEELLDGSLRLLDMCSAAKDALIHTKECARELQSIMRRRAGGDVGIEREVRKFFNSRKVVKKAIQKALKGMEDKYMHADKNHETLPMVSTLREIETVTLTVFESLLSFVAGQSKPSSWSLVSRLVLPKRVAHENEEAAASEFQKVEAALHSFITHKTTKSDYMTHVENVHNLLGNLESIVQDLEEGLECLFRRLIKTRVSLLNILNH